jgi:hypothetical protein
MQGARLHLNRGLVAFRGFRLFGLMQYNNLIFK